MDDKKWGALDDWKYLLTYIANKKNALKMPFVRFTDVYKTALEQLLECIILRMYTQKKKRYEYFFYKTTMNHNESSWDLLSIIC